MAGGHGVLREALFTFAWYLCLSRWTVLADVMVYDQGDTLVDEYNDLPARFGPQFPLDGEAIDDSYILTAYIYITTRLAVYCACKPPTAGLESRLPLQSPTFV